MVTSYIIGFIILSGLNNMLRGSEIGRPIISKFVTSLFQAIITGILVYVTHPGWLLPCIFMISVWLGVWLWAISGWGKYFMAINGHDAEDEKEVWWIDTVTRIVFGGRVTELSGIGRVCVQTMGILGIIMGRRIKYAFSMSLRGLHLYPMFIVLSLLNVYSLGCGLLCLLQGPCYFICGKLPYRFQAKSAEFLVGASVIALPLVLIINGM